MEEKRRYKRYSAELEVGYEVDNTVGIECRTNTSNISLGGVAMPVNKAVRERKTISLTLKMPGGAGEVKALGKIVWKKPINRNLPDEEDAGVKFLSMYENSKNVLTEYLQGISATT